MLLGPFGGVKRADKFVVLGVSVNFCVGQAAKDTQGFPVRFAAVYRQGARPRLDLLLADRRCGFRKDPLHEHEVYALVVIGEDEKEVARQVAQAVGESTGMGDSDGLELDEDDA